MTSSFWLYNKPLINQFLVPYWKYLDLSLLYGLHFLRSVNQNCETNIFLNPTILASCYRGQGGSPKTTFAPLKDVFPLLKFSKTIERTIVTVAYCLKTMVYCLLPPPKIFFSAESQQLVNKSIVLKRHLVRSLLLD